MKGKEQGAKKGHLLYHNSLFIHVQKETKTAKETARTFATLFADDNLRFQLCEAKTNAEFNNHLLLFLEKQQQQPQQQPLSDSSFNIQFTEDQISPRTSRFYNRIGSGLVTDIKRRAPFYASDFKDGTVFFLSPQIDRH